MRMPAMYADKTSHCSAYFEPLHVRTAPTSLRRLNMPVENSLEVSCSSLATETTPKKAHLARHFISKNTSVSRWQMRSPWDGQYFARQARVGGFRDRDT